MCEILLRCCGPNTEKEDASSKTPSEMLMKAALLLLLYPAAQVVWWAIDSHGRIKKPWAPGPGHVKGTSTLN